MPMRENRPGKPDDGWRNDAPADGPSRHADSGGARRGSRAGNDVDGADWSLPALRREIESIDHALLTLLARRQRVAEAIGRAKRVNGEPVLDPVREAAVVRRAAEGARERGLDEDAVRALFRQLIAMARAAQAG